MDYQVHLNSFRGPLDLLLFLVKRSEVDICDIPIKEITDQYLDYLKTLEWIDIEQAGEFLVMAATLMEIKSRMLLPTLEAAAEEDEDPRTNLVKQLIEYKQFKEAAALLEARAEEQSFRVPRISPPAPGAADPSLQPLREIELWDLVSAFGRIMQETLAQEPQPIFPDPTPVHVYMETIEERLRRETRVSFSSLFTPPRHRSRLIGIFLALLELIKASRALIDQPDSFGEIWILRGPGIESR